MGTLLTKTYSCDFPTLNLKEKSGFNFMSAPGGSLFLAFALYCSHTANTEVSNNTAYGIRNAGSCSACYWPLKSNLGTAIKAETPLPLTLLLHCCWPGNTRALTDHRAFLPDTNRTVFSKGATDLRLWKLVSGQQFQSEASSSSLHLLLMVDMQGLCQINGKIKFQSQTWL